MNIQNIHMDWNSVLIENHRLSINVFIITNSMYYESHKTIVKFESSRLV
jgi:hypothetical protein